MNRWYIIWIYYCGGYVIKDESTKSKSSNRDSDANSPVLRKPSHHWKNKVISHQANSSISSNSLYDQSKVLRKLINKHILLTYSHWWYKCNVGTKRGEKSICNRNRYQRMLERIISQVRRNLKYNTSNNNSVFQSNELSNVAR